MRTHQLPGIAALAIASFVLPCFAQSRVQTPAPQLDPVFDLEKDRQALVPLDGPWRFHAGDNGAWADPHFDDSAWPIFYPQRPWSEHKFSGSVWFRAKVRVPANQGPLALYLRYIDDSYQVFVDGRLITSAGGLPPHPYPYEVTPMVVDLPPHAPASEPYTMTLAVRVWLWPLWADYHTGGISPGSKIGSPELIQQASDDQNIHWAWGNVSQILLTFLEGLAGLTALALFVFRRNEQEYLWFAIAMLASSAVRGHSIYFQFHTLGVLEYTVGDNVLRTATNLAVIAFFYRLLGGRPNWLLWISIVSTLGVLGLIVPASFELISLPKLGVLVILLDFPATVWVLSLLIRRAVQGFPDARLLLAPVFVSYMLRSLFVALLFASFTNVYRGDTSWFTHTFSWPFDISLADVSDALFLLGILTVLVHRFTRTRSHEEAYEREREAARTVQRLLIPSDYPEIPGFEIASIYQPASEVSGDFFQIIALENGSALIAIGDVSGKGLPAALMVSLLIGTLRTYAETLSSPAQMLVGLNSRLHERTGMGGGFTTCLLLRADPDGSLTLANAGHLSPYCNGQEVPVDAGLPLGILADASFREITHQLALGETFTLLTDGVLEARNATGELFGFERTQAISQRAPAEVARIAKVFGQEDDITVVTIKLRPRAPNPDYRTA